MQVGYGAMITLPAQAFGTGLSAGGLYRATIAPPAQAFGRRTLAPKT